MELSVAVNLINKGVLTNSKAQVWADLGAGKGLFSTALSTLLAGGSVIHAVDVDTKALSNIELNSTDVLLNTIREDFTNMETEVPPLDGILMANSLHFVQDKKRLISDLRTKLNSEGRFIIVEYDMRQPNRWVPFPVGFSDLITLAGTLNLSVSKIGEHPSVYNSSNIYSAVLLL